MPMGSWLLPRWNAAEPRSASLVNAEENDPMCRVEGDAPMGQRMRRRNGAQRAGPQPLSMKGSPASGPV